MVSEVGIIISRPKDLEKKKKEFILGGADKIHVLSDFDRTITYGLDGDGNNTQSVISKLRTKPSYLGEDYFKEAHRLFNIYHPIEIDANFPLDKKIAKMHEWWRLHFNLIAKSKLTRALIKKVVNENPLEFRKDAKDFFYFLNKNNIPLIFMSAGLGDMIEGYLIKNKLNLLNVYIIGNRYDFDSSGKALRVGEPIIHVLNKKEVTLHNHPEYKKLIKRKNVLLLGDNLEDVDMVEGFDYDNLIKIGFLNENVKDNLNLYKKNFDIVLTGDQDMKFVNKLLEEILK